MSPVATARRIGLGARQSANWVQLLRFGLVGASGYVINLGVFALLTGILSLHHALAAVGAFVVAVSSNFYWNRHWTFRASNGHAGFQAIRFFTVSVAALAGQPARARGADRRRHGRAPLAGDRGCDRDAVQFRGEQAVDVLLEIHRRARRRKPRIGARHAPDRRAGVARRALDPRERRGGGADGDRDGTLAASARR